MAYKKKWYCFDNSELAKMNAWFPEKVRYEAVYHEKPSEYDLPEPFAIEIARIGISQGSFEKIAEAVWLIGLKQDLSPDHRCSIIKREVLRVFPELSDQQIFKMLGKWKPILVR